MIQLENLTPRIYYKQSRDFQFIGRLYDIVLNSIKTNADTIYYLPNGINADEQILDLLTLTLGFKAKHHYNSTQLAALCSVIPAVLRQKGSVQSVITMTYALLHAEGITDDVDYSIKDFTFTLYVPIELSNTCLLNDFMPYILPSGMSCRIIKEIKEKKPAFTKLGLKNFVDYYIQESAKTSELSVINKTFTDEAEAGNTVGILPNTTILNDYELSGNDKSKVEATDAAESSNTETTEDTNGTTSE